MHFESRFDLFAYEMKKASDITSVAFHQVNTLFYAKSLPRPCSRTVSGIFQLDLSSCNRMRRNNKSVIIFGVYYYSFRIVDYSIASQDIIEHGFEHDMVNASQIGRGAVLQPMSFAGNKSLFRELLTHRVSSGSICNALTDNRNISLSGLLRFTMLDSMTSVK